MNNGEAKSKLSLAGTAKPPLTRGADDIVSAFTERNEKAQEDLVELQVKNRAEMKKRGIQILDREEMTAAPSYLVCKRVPKAVLESMMLVLPDDSSDSRLVIEIVSVGAPPICATGGLDYRYVHPDDYDEANQRMHNGLRPACRSIFTVGQLVTCHPRNAVTIPSLNGKEEDFRFIVPQLDVYAIVERVLADGDDGETSTGS